METGVTILPDCGTTACIAGFVCLLYFQDKKGVTGGDEYRNVLSISFEEELTSSMGSVNDFKEECTLGFSCIRPLAVDLLGLTHEESNILFFFHDHDWDSEELPETPAYNRLKELSEEYKGVSYCPFERAKVAYRFIDAFIEYVKQSRGAIAA